MRITRKKLDILWNHVKELENRNRTNTVRLVHLKEESEAGGGLISCVLKIIREGFGFDENRPPKTVHIHFLRSTAWDKLLKVAKENGGVQWEGRRLSFFPDLSKELAMKRKKFATAKKQLHKKNIRQTLDRS